MRAAKQTPCLSLGRLLPIFLAMLMAFLLSGCGASEDKQGAQAGKPGMPGMAAQAPEVSVITVTRKSVPITLETTGLTESYREVEVRAQVSGTLLKRTYVEGAVVKKGDLLFEIDPTPFQSAVNQAKAMVSQQQAAVNKADRDIERLKPLLAGKAVAQKEYDDAMSAKEQARAGLDQALASLQQAEINLNYTQVTAPISGISGKVLKDEGSLISAASDSLLTRIHQIDPIYVNYSTSDTEYLTTRRELDEKRLLVPDGGKFDVELTLSDGSIYSKIGNLNFRDILVDTQTGTMQSRAEFENPDSILVPNQFVRVTMKGAVRPNTILVPQRAVQMSDAGHYVYVVTKEGKAEQKMVQAGDWSGADWIIESGLSDGDTVIVEGTIKVQPGAQVKAVPLEEASQTSAQAAASGASEASRQK